jgi:hypothetical protein
MFGLIVTTKRTKKVIGFSLYNEDKIMIQAWSNPKLQGKTKSVTLERVRVKEGFNAEQALQMTAATLCERFNLVEVPVHMVKTFGFFPEELPDDIQETDPGT